MDSFLFSSFLLRFSWIHVCVYALSQLLLQLDDWPKNEIEQKRNKENKQQAKVTNRSCCCCCRLLVIVVWVCVCASEWNWNDISRKIRVQCSDSCGNAAIFCNDSPWRFSLVSFVCARVADIASCVWFIASVELSCLFPCGILNRFQIYRVSQAKALAKHYNDNISVSFSFVVFLLVLSFVFLKFPFIYFVTCVRVLSVHWKLYLRSLQII